ncbi:MAG: two-component sensor histidine kinase [Rhodoferax sp.]|nr:two-component sensor histidine kinase [Rhodoferax sp.]MBP7491623.1 two-component sensor histidine kinase [Rhodoferax sp.]
MDGLKRAITQSLQFKLSVWLAAVITGFALLAGVFSFATTFHDANELQDDQLRQIVVLADQHKLSVTSEDPPVYSGVADPDSRVILQTLPTVGQAPEPANARDTVLPLPSNLPDGIQTLTVRDEPWRLMVRTLPNGTRIVAGQQTAIRDEIARDGALRTLLPLIVLIPVMLILTSVLIRQMFKPVKQLALELDERSQDDLRPLNESHLPTEIQPFVVANNRLLARVDQSMALQRRFLADAAHELRSPLTALSLQSERLGAAEMSAPARERLAALQGGLMRSRQLLDQLLALARAREADMGQAEPVSLRRMCHQVIEDLMPLAEAKDIDIGIEGEADASVLAHEIDLKSLVRNLVDNAIRYTPPAGKVDLSIQTAKGQATLQVSDSGPGIAEVERQRVFDPFYRILGNDEVGSGLGLSIVKTLADRMGATVALQNTDEKGPVGLRVCVQFSAQNA